MLNLSLEANLGQKQGNRIMKFESTQLADAKICVTNIVNKLECCAAISSRHLDFKWQYTVGGN